MPIKVTNATSVSCVDLLEQGKVDLIVTNFPNAHLNHSYIQKTVCNFTDVFIANPAYFNLKQQEIPFEELKQYPILMLDHKSTTSEFLHNLFLQHQLELIPEVELSSNDLLIDLARIGLGIAFIPDYCLSRESKDLYVVKTKKTTIPPDGSFDKSNFASITVYGRIFKTPAGVINRSLTYVVSQILWCFYRL